MIGGMGRPRTCTPARSGLRPRQALGGGRHLANPHREDAAWRPEISDRTKTVTVEFVHAMPLPAWCSGSSRPPGVVFSTSSGDRPPNSQRLACCDLQFCSGRVRGNQPWPEPSRRLARLARAEAPHARLPRCRAASRAGPPRRRTPSTREEPFACEASSGLCLPARRSLGLAASPGHSPAAGWGPPDHRPRAGAPSHCSVPHSDLKSHICFSLWTSLPHAFFFQLLSVP